MQSAVRSGLGEVSNGGGGTCSGGGDNRTAQFENSL